jgi:hypothetical protein
MHITRRFSEGSQPCEKLPFGILALSHLWYCSGRRDRLLLHAQVDLNVPVSCSELAVTEPRCDGGDIDACLEEMHCCCVANYMGCHTPRMPWRQFAEPVNDCETRTGDIY